MRSFNLLYEEFKSNLLKEGGNAVPGVDRIAKKDIEDTVRRFKEEIVVEFLKKDPGDRLCMIGSTGKKESSGDIDLALDFSVVKDESKIYSLIKLNEICGRKGYNSVINTFTYDMLHVAFPQADGKLVQVDLLLTDNFEFTKFFMYSPAESESNYKGAHRNDLLKSILKVNTFVPEEYDDNGELVKWSQLEIKPEGIYKEVKTLVDENGDRLTYKDTNEPLEAGYAKAEQSFLIEADVEKTIEVLVGKGYSVEDIDTFEKLFAIIKDDDNFKWHDKSEEILKETAQLIKEQEKRLVFPEELKDYLE